MLDNEPTNNAPEGASEDNAQTPADKPAVVKTVRRKRATRPAGPPQPPADETAAGEVPSGDAASGTAAAPLAAAPAEAAAEPPADATAGQPAAAAAEEAGEGGPTAKAPARRRRSRAQAGAPAEQGAEGEAQGDGETAAGVVGAAAALADAAEEPRTPPMATAPLFQAPEVAPLPPKRREPAKTAEEPSAEAEEEQAEDAAGEDAEEGEATGARRRRRRGGRGRRGGRADGDAEGAETEEPADEAAESEAEDEEAEHGDDEDGTTAASRRRRRRRRRAGEAVEGSPDDPAQTVIKVREAREPESEVATVKGSTRLEAKKQRRREGREAGRRRAPIITEAEFLARREAVERVMVVRQNGERTQIAVLEDGVLVEHYVNKAASSSLVGNVYLGKVQNVLPSMEAAFVDIGKGRNAVLYAGEVNFDAAGLEGQPKRIEHALKSGQSVLVQVTKDPIGHKGARLTSQVSLPGRYLVYVPEGSMTGISRKLPDTERTRLKNILKKIVPDNAGVIVRTAAEGASEEELSRDVARLTAQWEDIQKKVNTASAPALLYGEPDLTIRVVRDIFNEDFSKVVVAGDDAWDMLDAYVGHVAPDLVDRLSRWTKEDDVFSSFRVDEQLAKALDRKVWLPSGGSLVIDRTEAMTVIDVNTGKFTGQGGNLEETVTRNNLEAAEEIVRQLRLRDIGGIIVVDFIDMVLESNRDLVLRRLLECLGRDRTKHQVAEVTSLGLVQMTRKRVGQGLLEAFSESCECCNGRGVIVRMEPVEAKPAGERPERPERDRRRRRSGRGGGGSNGTGPATGEAPAEEAPVETLEAGPVDAEAPAEMVEAWPIDAETSEVETSEVEAPVVASADLGPEDIDHVAVQHATTEAASDEADSDEPASDEPVTIEPPGAEPIEPPTPGDHPQG